VPLGWMRRPGRRTMLPCACLLVVTATAMADPGSTGPRVEVLIAGSDAEVSALAEALDDPLRRLDVELSVRLRRGQTPAVNPEEVASPSRRAAPAVARMWFDLTEPGHAALYITDGGWQRIYVRRIALPAGLDEVAREQLTYIARTSVETLLAGGQIGVTREEFERQLPSHAEPKPEPKPEPPRPPAPEWRLGAAVLYAVEGYARTMPVTHGPGIDGWLVRSRSGLSPFVSASAELRWRRHIEHETVVARLDGTAFRVGLGAELAVGGPLVLRGLLGGGMDVWHVKPEKGSDATVQISSPMWAVDPVLRGALGLGFRAGRLTTWLGTGADLGPRPSRYVLLRDGSPVDVLKPWPWRPWVGIELGWDFWRKTP
jgi:hypothetical protein